MNNTNQKAYDPYRHQDYEWNGSSMVEVDTPHCKVRSSIRAHRKGTIWSAVHIPPEKAGFGR